MLELIKQNPTILDKEIHSITKKINALEEKKVLLNNLVKDYRFLEVINGCEQKTDEEYLNSILWTKDGVNYFELNKQTNKLWCDHDYVWSVFEKEFKMGYSEIKIFISKMMDKYCNYKGLLPWKDSLYSS